MSNDEDINDQDDSFSRKAIGSVVGGLMGGVKRVGSSVTGKVGGELGKVSSGFFNGGALSPAKMVALEKEMDELEALEREEKISAIRELAAVRAALANSPASSQPATPTTQPRFEVVLPNELMTEAAEKAEQIAKLAEAAATEASAAAAAAAEAAQAAAAAAAAASVEEANAYKELLREQSAGQSARKARARGNKMGQREELVREVNLRDVDGTLEQGVSKDATRARKIAELQAELRELRELRERSDAEKFEELQELQELLQLELLELQQEELQEVQELNEARQMPLASRRDDEPVEGPPRAATSPRETPEKMREAALMLRAMAVDAPASGDAVEC